MNPVNAARYGDVAGITRRTRAASSAWIGKGWPRIPIMKFTGLVTDCWTVRTASRS